VATAAAGATALGQAAAPVTTAAYAASGAPTNGAAAPRPLVLQEAQIAAQTAALPPVHSFNPAPAGTPLRATPRQAQRAPEAPQPAPDAEHAMGGAAPSRSLFGLVTGAIRRTLPAGAPAPAGQATADVVSVSARQAAGDEVGLDIPAFLRRQSS
jgi:cell division protein FtsZ